jgi:synaptobrevin family protein YKT6
MGTEYVAFVYVRTDNLACVIVTDALYPSRVAFSLVNKISDEFISKYPTDRWVSLVHTNTPQFYPELRSHLTKAQDPESSDPFMKVQKELDETKVILHKTMASLLERGEKLDDLVAKSDQLSAQSKMFYKTAKKTNACCVSSLFLISLSSPLWNSISFGNRHTFNAPKQFSVDLFFLLKKIAGNICITQSFA